MRSNTFGLGWCAPHGAATTFPWYEGVHGGRVNESAAVELRYSKQQAYPQKVLILPHPPILLTSPATNAILVGK